MVWQLGGFPSAKLSKNIAVFSKSIQWRVMERIRNRQEF